MLLIPVVEILRLEENFTYGTFGSMRINKEVFCVTLERPDILNKPFVSSIPAQQYLCERTISPKFGETFEITNVPDRDHVLLHAANLMVELEGCIALAQYVDKLKGDRAILNSGNTFKKFMAIMEGYNKFHLTIKEIY